MYGRIISDRVYDASKTGANNVTDKLQTPLAYLWTELEGLLNDATIAELRRRVAVHTAAYNRAAKIRQAERELHVYEKIVQYGYEDEKHRLAPKIERCRARIKALEDEQNVT